MIVPGDTVVVDEVEPGVGPHAEFCDGVVVPLDFYTVAAVFDVRGRTIALIVGPRFVGFVWAIFLQEVVQAVLES